VDAGDGVDLRRGSEDRSRDRDPQRLPHGGGVRAGCGDASVRHARLRLGEGVPDEQGNVIGIVCDEPGGGEVVTETDAIGGASGCGDRHPGGAAGYGGTGVEPEPGQGAGAGGLDDDVGGADEKGQRSSSPGGRGVKDHRFVTTVQKPVEVGVAASGAVGAVRGFDLHHAGTGEAEQMGA